MKNPNGYGSVFKLSGKRRRPFAVRITTGWNDDGKQTYEYLDYFASRQDAMIALANYNSNPYDPAASKVTFAELYELYSEEKFYKVVNGVKELKFSKSSVSGYRMAFKRSELLHDMKFVDIRKSHMQEVIDRSDKSYGTKRKIKVLFNQLFKFAMENDLVMKDYAAFVELGKDDTVSSRNPFDLDEIEILWNNVDRMEFIDTVLIMIYTGMRPGELITIKNKDINLEERYMRGGIKNDAGKNRVIPIHKKIHPLIKRLMHEDHKYLVVNHEKKKMRYWNYYEEKWKPIMEQLEIDHRPHDCRHTFATLMDNADANKLSIKRIMGHAAKDITDKVYTHKDMEQLIKAIDLI